MTNYLEGLIFVGGILHFGVLIAGAVLPSVLDWKTALKKLDVLSREVIWVHFAFIALVVISFGALSVLFAGVLTTGSTLARAVCFMIALFWGARLMIQVFVFDARPMLKNLFLKAGYHGLTVVFTYQAIVYSLAAFLPR